MNTCKDCNKPIVSDGIGTGYARNEEGDKICYECCGVRDKATLESLKLGEKYALCLTKEQDKYYLTNWPNTLRIRIWSVKKGCHRTDFWFDFRGREFHGTQYGNDSQIAYVKRIKK